MVCRLCGYDTVEILIDFGSQPIVHNLLKAPEDQAKRYPFRLGNCQTCGFLQITEPIDPDILYENYFTISSWKNQPHVPKLIDILESIGGITSGSGILDIGCNDGSFLKALQHRGYARVSGIEPTKDASEKALEAGLDVYHGFFSQETADKFYTPSSFDVVTTRQVLEHIVDLDDFLLGVNHILKEEGIFVIEIPDSEWNLDYLDYALWEEHVNYFTLKTLKQLLHKHSLVITHHEVTLFSGRALIVFCEKRQTSNKPSSGKYINYDRDKIKHYGASWESYLQKLHHFLSSQGSPIAMYGCGARSSTFVNFTGISELIDCFIDDQLEKQDLFVPGSNLEINSWNESKYRDYVFLLGVNTENEHKVITRKALPPGKYYSILPPSRYLPEFWKSLIYA
ncbi:MAG: class I SAM-dependent methyltransferase [Cyanobacteria bacterium J06639_16]